MNVWWKGFLIGFGFFLAVIALIYVWLLITYKLIGKEYLDNYLDNMETRKHKRAAIVPIPQAEETDSPTDMMINPYIVTVVPDATVIS